MGQTGNCFEVRQGEHTRYVKTNNTNSSNELYILNNRHGYGSTEETIDLLKTCNEGEKMNC